MSYMEDIMLKKIVGAVLSVSLTACAGSAGTVTDTVMSTVTTTVTDTSYDETVITADTGTEISLEDTAVTRMQDLSVILAVMGASPMYTSEDGAPDGYVRVTDGRFGTMDSFTAYIEDICADPLRSELLKGCGECLTEQDGALYAKQSGRSFFMFRTDGGVTISDADASRFTAETVDGDDLYGPGRAVFVYDGGTWRIESYTYG